MKVFLIRGDRGIYNFMYDLFLFSLEDLGYYNSDINRSDIIISLCPYPKSIKKEIGKKYVYLQVQQRDSDIDQNQREISNKIIDNDCKFPDIVWGFDINAKSEKYFCLGYHPKLDRSHLLSMEDKDVSFLGSKSERRINFLEKLYVPVNFINKKEFDVDKKSKWCRDSKINLDFKALSVNDFTCWDRISLLIHNRCFIICEKCYCPLEGISMFDKNDSNGCNELIKYYIGNKKERECKSQFLYEEYKKNFDMRVILQERLKI